MIFQNINSLSPPNLGKGTVLTMGTFDGVHLGHQFLIKKLISISSNQKIPSVVLTYSRHPNEVINRQIYPYLLTETKKKEMLLKDLGVDSVLFLNFNKSMAAMSPAEFLKDIILGELRAKVVVFGYDCHFGKDRKGNYTFLKENQDSYNYRTLTVEPYEKNGTVVSSSMIRDLVRSGEMLKVSSLLGRNYSVLGSVVKGSNIGRALGFPTLNVKPADENKLLPPHGVYISLLKLKKKTYPGVSNVGVSPTLKQLQDTIVETHLFNFHQNLYNESIEVEFIKKIRDEEKFLSQTDLIRQIRNDVILSRKYFYEQKNP